ncbi:hypothetical protein GCM10010869_06730 [Mesorhizobium tianshanense]|nr:hypothetical protein GCM10010869_06730 [Mesorhizobium tianshanense]
MKDVPDKIRRRPVGQRVQGSEITRIVEIKSPLILQSGQTTLTDGLDAIAAALRPLQPFAG